MQNRGPWQSAKHPAHVVVEETLPEPTPDVIHAPENNPYPFFTLSPPSSLYFPFTSPPLHYIFFYFPKICEVGYQHHRGPPFHGQPRNVSATRLTNLVH